MIYYFLINTYVLKTKYHLNRFKNSILRKSQFLLRLLNDSYS